MGERYFHDEFVCNLDSGFSSVYKNSIIAENCQFRDQSNEMQKENKNQEDAKQLYRRGLLQLANVVTACIVLAVLLYRQK